MSFEDYKAHLKKQKAWIKQKKQGEFYYVSSDIYYAPEDVNRLFGLRTTYPPFVGKMKDVLVPIVHPR